MAPVSLLTCRVVVGGERDGTAAVFPLDGVTRDGMVWHRRRWWPKKALTWLGQKKGGRDGAAARFVEVGVATAVNLTMGILGNAAHLGEISSSQEVDKKAELEADSETPVEVTRCEGENARSSRSSRRQWRWRLYRQSHERERQSEWAGAGWVRGGVSSMTASMTWRVGPTSAYGCQMAPRWCLIELLWR